MFLIVKYVLGDELNDRFEDVTRCFDVLPSTLTGLRRKRRSIILVTPTASSA